MIALLKNKSIYIPLFVDWRGDGPNDCRVLAGGSGGKLLIAFDKELLRDSKLINRPELRHDPSEPLGVSGAGEHLRDHTGMGTAQQ